MSKEKREELDDESVSKKHDALSSSTNSNTKAPKELENLVNLLRRQLEEITFSTKESEASLLKEVTDLRERCLYLAKELEDEKGHSEELRIT